MARTREILLVVVLAVATAPCAAAGGGPVRGCQAEVLAPTVALFCGRGGLPPNYCCQALSHSAIVGGGPRCLCRLATEPPLVNAALNGTGLLSLYTSCTAGSAHPPAPSSCDGQAPAPAAAAAPADSTGCDTAVLADQTSLFCRGVRPSSSASPPWPCCEAVVGSGRKGHDGVPCFCHVAESTGFGVDRICSIYAACVASGPGEGLHISADMCKKKGPRHGDDGRV